MIRIQRLTLREIRLPLREPFEISSGVVKDRRITLLQLRDADGRVGWSECVAEEMPNYSPETIETAWLAIREWIAPRILDKTFRGPEEIHEVLEQNFRGHRMAKAAVEMGIWELAAQIHGVPLARLLGGTRESIATGISLGIQKNPHTLVEKARASLEQGYRKIKIKIKPGADVEYVQAVREAFGPDAPLMVDANNAYTLQDLDRLRQLDAFGLIMIEQPLAWDDLVRHAALQKQIKTPICLDESITGVDKAEDMLALGSGKIINIKPGRVGGFSSSLAIHHFCAQNNIPVWCGGMLESGVGRAHNVALASLPNFVFPGDLSPSARYWERDIVIPEWAMDKQGMVKVPLDRPGMGVNVDLDRVDDLTVRCEMVGKWNMKSITCILLLTVAFIACEHPNPKFLQYEWVKQVGGQFNDRGEGIAIDGSGNGYITGAFSGTASFLWAKHAGGTEADSGKGIAVDRAGNIFVTGVFSGKADFEGDTLKSEGVFDIFLARYDNSGNLIWASQGGKKGVKQNAKIAMHPLGRNFITTGHFSGETAFGGSTLRSEGEADVFAASATTGGRATALKASARPNTKILLTWKNNADAGVDVEVVIERSKLDSPAVAFQAIKTLPAKLQFYMDADNLLLATNYAYRVSLKDNRQQVSAAVQAQTRSTISLAQHSNALELDDKGGGDDGWRLFPFADFNQIYHGHLQLRIKGKDTTRVFDGDDNDFISATGIALNHNKPDSAAARAKGSADEHTSAASSVPEQPVIMKCKGDNVEIGQFTYKNKATGDSYDWILAEWNVRNADSLAKELKLALFLDADAAGQQWRKNLGGFDDTLKLVYLFNDARTNEKDSRIHVGMALISDTSAFESFQISEFDASVTPDNSEDQPPGQGEQARLDLFAGRNTGILSNEPGDLTMTLVSDLRTVKPGDSVKVMYAIAVAKSLDDLKKAIREAADFCSCASPWFWADVDRDGDVDADDIAKVQAHWPSNKGAANYNSRADVNLDANKRHCGDGKIDVLDIQLVAAQVPPPPHVPIASANK